MKRQGAVLSLLFLAATLSASHVSATEPPKTERIVPEIEAYRINPNPPSIDGDLDDAVWTHQNIAKIDDFTQREPTEGEPATESTLVAVAYDDDAIYFAFWCYDSEPDQITRQLVRRDRSSNSDAVYVRLDPYHDHQTGFAFEVNAAGVQRDERFYDENNADYSWNGIWESAAKLHPWGWAAEIRIPFYCLRFPEKTDHVWGADFVRVITRKDEAIRWAYTPSSEGKFISNFGHITGLTGISPRRNLEVLPYTVASLETEHDNPGNPDGKNTLGDLGIDVKYGISSNLTLNASINPDFGQVELDQPVLNLSTTETYYPELRPFFFEGMELFQTEFRMFYSRRIGRPPTIWPDDVDYYIDRPKATTILGAAKLTGKFASGTSISFLNALTKKEKATYVDTEGETVEAVVEPLADYSVLRVKQDVLANSDMGMFVTVASQDTRHPSVVGGLDCRLQTNNGMWQFKGQVLGNRNDGENSGLGFDAMFSKISGKHFRGCFGYTVKDRYFDINPLGYNSRDNSRHLYSWFQWRTTDDWWIIRDSWSNINISQMWNFDGYNISKNFNFNGHYDFTNGWNLGFGVDWNPGKFDDRETRGNGLWERPESMSWWASLETDERKMISLVLNPGSGATRYGTWWAHYTGLEFRPKSNMEFSVGVNYERYNDFIRWVDNPDDTTTIFADLDQDEITVSASAAVTVHPNLSIQLSARGLISGLDYENYREYDGGRFYSQPVDGYNEDGNYSALNSTLLIRWEYSPGSTVYLVWTRSRPEWDDTINNVDISRDFDRYFSTGAENVFMIKASYWMNL